ncbi:unnamed protein product [Rotaria socialis]|uniref:Cadherin domain-containing protein n=1 Tax=Rotaria socialis TaxID=392032 RepID=A0A820ZHB2_9BILA|nr:unnamed protein product [Rotaria socialis]
MIFLRFLFIIYFTNATYLYFERESYEIFISESIQIYTKIALIKAISYPSLSIQYELHGDTNQSFYLNSLTGELTLLNPVDYETIPIYKLTVEARSTSAVAPCFSELIIHVLNINDNPPDINLIIYPSLLYKSNTIKYDLNISSTPFATINIKDFDESTKNLSLYLNDTEHFQVQLIRQIKNDVIYILSTKNNAQLIDQDDYYLLLTACDNDQPLLCTNQTYKFHMKSNEFLCNLSFSQKVYIIDIKENTPAETFLMHKITNKFCRNITYSIDDTKNFYIDSSTGDLFTLTKFNRTEQSIYSIQLFVNYYIKIQIIIRIVDQYGNIPFLTSKYSFMNQRTFLSARLFNSTLCRPQAIIENYFQLLPNCTILSLMKPPSGQYLFNIELEQRINYKDTFLLELKEEQEHKLTFRNSQWITIIISIIIKADGLSTVSKLKVYDDHESSLAPSSTTLYLVQKPSPPLSSLSPLRDDEGYSGSSNVSENHLPLESTVISVNGLIEQYHVHEFPKRPSKSSGYDTPRRYSDRINGSRVSRDITLV